MCLRTARLIFWCSGVTECPTEDETIISSRCDNGTPVVTGTEAEYEGEEERGGERRSESEVGGWRG